MTAVSSDGLALFRKLWRSARWCCCRKLGTKVAATLQVLASSSLSAEFDEQMHGTPAP